MEQEWMIPGHGWQTATLRGAGADVLVDIPHLRQTRQYDDPTVGGFEKLQFACDHLDFQAHRFGVLARAPGRSTFRFDPLSYSTTQQRWQDGRPAEVTLNVVFGELGARLEVAGRTVFATGASDVFQGVVAAVRRAKRFLLIHAPATDGAAAVDDSPSPVLCAERWSAGIDGHGPPPVTVRIHEPEALVEPGNDKWRCRYRIDGVVAGPMYALGGLDPVEALSVTARELRSVWHSFPSPKVRVLVPPPPTASWSGEVERRSGVRSAVRLGPFARAGRGAWTCVAGREGVDLTIGARSPLACLIGAVPVVHY